MTLLCVEKSVANTQISLNLQRAAKAHQKPAAAVAITTKLDWCFSSRYRGECTALFAKGPLKGNLIGRELCLWWCLHYTSKVCLKHSLLLTESI